MRVAIDSGPLTGGDAIRGIGFHTKELLKELEKLQNKDFQIEAVDFKNADLSKYDVIHYPYFIPHALTLPFVKPSKKVIVTIHDLIRLIYPENYPPGIKGQLKFLIQKFNLRNVDSIITISETSKKDIVRFLNINPEKIFVTYLAPQTKMKTKSEQKLNLPKDFVLYVGDVNFNKNLLNLAKAIKIAKLKLVIVGKQAVNENVDDNIENKPWREFLRLYKNDPDIIRLGFVEDLDDVFKKATLYCQPSFYEGFGLPILEAFERNVPVVASRTQALVEVGDNSCVYFDPKNPDDIAEKLLEVFKDKKLQDELIKKGRNRLKKFSWEKCARATLSVYETI
ncbi:MAG TPA: glycosyltransferase family 1 protein [Patescibacteria group bacterium]|nr:glycosyltransferase family 1 protein [Patescibacteria group bacterium]